ncbi:Flp pilus assembly complex ATPase component TadA [Patescibacteria group bacterium]|nr:Flp pilus assembly complex ATPase component TadA [Patescibacteria group bacterium]
MQEEQAQPKEKKEDLVQILLSQNFISEEDGKKAVQAQANGNMSVEEYFISEDILTKDLIGQAIAEHHKVKYTDLNSRQPNKELVAKLPGEIAKKYHAIIFSEEKKAVNITTDRPDDPGLKSAVASVFPGKTVKITYSLPEDIKQILLFYREPLFERIVKLAEQEESAAPKIVEEILQDAVVMRTSDVHFEPQEDYVMIRFRIDGVLKPMVKISRAQYESVLNRMKVMAHLRTDQHLSTQDGSIRFVSGGEQVDIRMSIAPVFDGEKVALRLLSAYAKSFALSDLGFSLKDRETLAVQAKKPFGMILVVGPTGSGKTTTLYGLLKSLNKPEVNITTIEDPVEYKIAGVNHIQVNNATELTFARGLRSIVRQDPDIILVGEIRDKETSEISVNAALTGHLLLSTFHANDAATSIPRLLDMGTEPFLLSSTLEAVVAQRLVRKICEHCRYSENLKVDEVAKQYPAIKKVIKEKTVTLYKGKGCDVCGHSGYFGRTGIFEIIVASAEINSLIMKNPTSQAIWELARQEGSVSMYEDGIQKVLHGVTTIDELERVVSPPKELGYVDQQKVNEKQAQAKVRSSRQNQQSANSGTEPKAKKELAKNARREAKNTKGQKASGSKKAK